MNVLLVISLLIHLLPATLHAQTGSILVPMDHDQSNHLKAYGFIFRHLARGAEAEWILDYRGGSFLLPESTELTEEALRFGITIQQLDPSQTEQLLEVTGEHQQESARIPLREAPRIAVYAPPESLPWNDAVRMVLDYADVPYDLIYDQEILDGILEEYDWIHLHHEDFTGQHGKFWSLYQHAPWYVESVERQEQRTQDLGFESVSMLKREIAFRLRSYVVQGGYLFAMCSGTNTLDLALAAGELDIVDWPFDGTPPEPDLNEKLDYRQTLAFHNFDIITDPMMYRHDTIDIEPDLNQRTAELDYFTLFHFSPRWDPVPSMLTQNHESSIRGFFGQTTAFRKETIKPSVTLLGEARGRDEVKYLFGRVGEGSFTFYGGHDPEDYMHRVNDPPTDLEIHPNSPGYRLILNNILFPSADEPERET